MTKYCNEDVAKWSLPCGYPRQWLYEGGCLVDDDAPVGIPCIIGPDGKPVRDENGLLASRAAGYIVAWEPLCGGGTITAYDSLVLNDKEAMNICKELNKKFGTDLYRYHPVQIYCMNGRLVALADDGRQVLVVL